MCVSLEYILVRRIPSYDAYAVVAHCHNSLHFHITSEIEHLLKCLMTNQITASASSENY